MVLGYYHSMMLRGDQSLYALRGHNYSTETTSCWHLFPFTHTASFSFTVIPVEALLPLFQLSLPFSLLVIKESCPLLSVFVFHDATVLGAPTGQSRGSLVEIQLGRPSRQLCTSRFREVDRFENTKWGRETREGKRSRFDFHSFLPLPSYWLFYFIKFYWFELTIWLFCLFGFAFSFCYFSSFYYVLAIRLHRACQQVPVYECRTVDQTVTVTISYTSC